MSGLDWSAIKCFSSTGECSNADDMLWLMAQAGYKPVIEYCGGTELAGGYMAGTLVQPQVPAAFSTPTVGTELAILDESGHLTDNGEVFLVPPAVGMSVELINRDHREVYFEDAPPGPQGQVLRRHGDQVERLAGGFYRAHGRADDTMNLGCSTYCQALSKPRPLRCLRAKAVPADWLYSLFPSRANRPSLLNF